MKETKFNSGEEPEARELRGIFPAMYQFKVHGHLDADWGERFGGLTVALDQSGCTVLTGPVTDQSQLYGILKLVRNSAMPLILVERLSGIHDCRREPTHAGEKVKPQPKTNSRLRAKGDINE